MDTDGMLLCSTMPTTGQYPHQLDPAHAFALSFLNVSFFLWRSSTRFWVMASPYGDSRPLSLDTRHSSGLLCTSDQPVTENSDNTQHS